VRTNRNLLRHLAGAGFLPPLLSGCNANDPGGIAVYAAGLRGERLSSRHLVQ
jgi:hypothetical protein